VSELTVHHGTGLGDGIQVAASQPDDLESVSERSEGVAKLVSQQGKELVLLSIPVVSAPYSPAWPIASRHDLVAGTIAFWLL
jgi:hypothetical protein